MSKKIIVATKVAGALAAVLSFWACSGGGETQGQAQSGKGRATVVCEATAEAPALIKGYIDASGSMKGYFSRGSDGRFLTAISNAFMGYDQNLVWLDGRLRPIKGTLNTTMLTASYSGADSKFDEMLARIQEDLQIDSLNNLGLLFTDGIISSKSSDTQKDPEHTLKSKDVLRNEVTRSLCPNVAVVLCKFASRYAGAYFDYHNRPVNVTVGDRPFYVIAIGNPKAVRHYMKNNKLSAELTAVWGTFNQTIDPGTKHALTPTPPANWKNGTFTAKDKEVAFTVSLPDYLKELGAEYVKGNFKVIFNGKDVTNEGLLLTVNNDVTSAKLSWETAAGKQRSAKLRLRKGANKVELKVLKKLPQGFDALFCEDDTNMQNDSAQQCKTFLLEYLMQGIANGVEPREKDEDNVIFATEVSFNF